MDAAIVVVARAAATRIVVVAIGRRARVNDDSIDWCLNEFNIMMN